MHEEYVRAGAQVIIANTFAANRPSLEAAGFGCQVAEVNHAAMRAARPGPPTRRKPRRVLPDLGDGGTFEDLVSALARPGLAAITVMHAGPELTLDAIKIIRRHYAGPVGTYAETGDSTPPNWVFSGLTPQQYLAHAVT